MSLTMFYLNPDDCILLKTTHAVKRVWVGQAGHLSTIILFRDFDVCFRKCFVNQKKKK